MLDNKLNLVENLSINIGSKSKTKDDLESAIYMEDCEDGYIGNNTFVGYKRIATVKNSKRIFIDNNESKK
jgi:hypothetical protein